MMEVVIGGSGSGKSQYGEKRIEKARGNMPGYYIATMRVFGEEERQRVAKHRQQRKGMDFYTIEQEKNLAEVVNKMKQGKGAALLECVPNLVANELFDLPEEAIRDEKRTAERTKRILSEIACLNEACTHFVVITGNVFEDGIRYDEMTKNYMQCLSQVNAGLGAMADTVVEVVAGIPIWLKGEKGR